MTVAGIDRLLARGDVARLAKLLEERPGLTVDEPGVRRAAVALILREGVETSLDLLLIKRAVFAGDPWSGQIALPGGREEPGDRTLAETAIRETREETGLDLSRMGRIIGTLDDLRPRTVHLPAIIVRPFIVVADCDDSCNLAAEVAEAFWVPVARLANPAARRTATVHAAGAERSVMAYHHANHVIWGMTERILRQFLAYMQVVTGEAAVSAPNPFLPEG
jgi:8-oxo-dGTP pyrophosphatase MutT (NUDIX family)